MIIQTKKIHRFHGIIRFDSFQSTKRAVLSIESVLLRETLTKLRLKLGDYAFRQCIRISPWWPQIVQCLGWGEQGGQRGSNDPSLLRGIHLVRFRLGFVSGEGKHVFVNQSFPTTQPPPPPPLRSFRFVGILMGGWKN